MSCAACNGTGLVWEPRLPNVEFIRPEYARNDPPEQTITTSVYVPSPKKVTLTWNADKNAYDVEMESKQPAREDNLLSLSDGLDHIVAHVEKSEKIRRGIFAIVGHFRNPKPDEYFVTRWGVEKDSDIFLCPGHLNQGGARGICFQLAREIDEDDPRPDGPVGAE